MGLICVCVCVCVCACVRVCCKSFLWNVLAGSLLVVLLHMYRKMAGNFLTKCSLSTNLNCTVLVNMCWKLSHMSSISAGRLPAHDEWIFLSSAYTLTHTHMHPPHTHLHTHMHPYTHTHTSHTPSHTHAPSHMHLTHTHSKKTHTLRSGSPKAINFLKTDTPNMQMTFTLKDHPKATLQYSRC